MRIAALHDRKKAIQQIQADQLLFQLYERMVIQNQSLLSVFEYENHLGEITIEEIAGFMSTENNCAIQFHKYNYTVGSLLHMIKHHLKPL